MWWEPFTRSSSKPARSKAAMASGPLTWGSLGTEQHPERDGSGRLPDGVAPGDVLLRRLVALHHPLQRLGDVGQSFVLGLTLAVAARQGRDPGGVPAFLFRGEVDGAQVAAHRPHALANASENGRRDKDRRALGLG